MDKAVVRLPLEVFRFFEVAGRHQSFAKAARELGVTPGAVAHRVRTLEQYLGEELFERQSHGLALSARGQAFLVEVQHILSALEKTTERFRAGAKGGVLKLVAVEAFAEMWLMPRLAAFRCAHPEIVIEFETDHYEVDPARRATSSRSLPEPGRSPRRGRSWTGSGPRREGATRPGSPWWSPPREAKAVSEDGGPERRPAARGRLRHPGLSLLLGQDWLQHRIDYLLLTFIH